MSNIVILVEPTTAAVTSDVVTLSMDSTAMSAICNGLSGSEEVTVEVYDPAQEQWYPYLYNGESPTFSTTTNNVMDFYQTWAQYRFVKPVTVAPVGISVIKFQQVGV